MGDKPVIVLGVELKEDVHVFVGARLSDRTVEKIKSAGYTLTGKTDFHATGEPWRYTFEKV